MDFIKNKKGYIVLVVSFFVMAIMLSFAIAMSSVTFYGQKTATNSAKSTQSYYAAESGIEDALQRLRTDPQISSLNYSLAVNGANTTIDISNIVAGSRTILATADTGGIIKKIQAVYGLGGDNIQFYYGVQVGEGGLVMDNGSRVMGNVFSNGNITGSGTIDYSAIISGNGHSLQGVRIKGDVSVHNCSGSIIDGTLTLVQGGTNTCTANGGTQIQEEEISQQPMPIPQSQVDEWKTEAINGTTIPGDFVIGNNSTRTLGPAVINGSLRFGNKSTLVITGTIYVKGNVDLDNTDVVRLDSSYGPSGGVLLSDGTINTGTGNTFSGSGQPGSYLLFLSTSASDSAIVLRNNSAGAAFYTTAGGIQLTNNISVLEATGYKLILSNNAVIQPSVGIVNIFFSGPAAAWKVKSWQEQ